MDLCKRFDCRFILVHDRYDDKLHGKDRSVEEIKDRYYKITAPMNQSKNDTKVNFWPLKGSKSVIPNFSDCRLQHYKTGILGSIYF